VSGKRLLHLMCHIGLDTLSWARRGAIVTGLDFSRAAVDTAVSLAARAGIGSARFVAAEIGEAGQALGVTARLAPQRGPSSATGRRRRRPPGRRAAVSRIPRGQGWAQVTLAAAGILETVGERRVRGAVERRYRLRREQASVSQETFESASREDHRRAFAAATAALLAEFNAYLDHDDADPAEKPSPG
jgi:hypothetical protein